MSTADDNEKTVTGPPTRRALLADDQPTGLDAERRRGQAGSAQQPGHTLPPGTRLRDYEITGLIGEGGFGIVYLAWDHSLQRKVAVKEYMPASMAARVAGSSAIVVKSERHLDTFKAGLKSFVNEARLLARFDHPSLVKVYRFWEENGTAYMVMPYYEGPTLKTALAELGHVPNEAELRLWLKPLLDALTVMHAAQCYHRDIAPDNILLTPRGPLLLDFGAARRVIGDMTHAITVVLKPGYAPIEQYGDVASMAQGAWTDLYALACVVYYAITGKTPVSSVERLMDDRLEPLSATMVGRYSPAFLRAIDAALAVRPADRPQNEQQFRAMLDADLPPAAPLSSGFAALSDDNAPAGTYSTVPGTLTPELATQLLAPRTAPPEAAAPVGPPAALPPLHAGLEATLVTPRQSAPPSLQVDAAPSMLEPETSFAAPLASLPDALETAAPLSAAPSRKGLWLALVLGLVVVAGVLFWWQQRPRADTGAVRGDNAASTLTTPAPAPASAATAVVTSSASAAAPSFAAPTSSSPGVAEAPAPSVTNAASAPIEAPLEATRPAEATPSATLPVERPAATHEAGTAVPSTTTPSTATARPRREPASPRGEPAAAVIKEPVPRPRAGGSRCSDILQKASLEPLTADEADYLKRECR